MIHIYAQFYITTQPNMHAYGLWEETRVLSQEEHTNSNTGRPHLAGRFNPIMPLL